MAPAQKNGESSTVSEGEARESLIPQTLDALVRGTERDPQATLDRMAKRVRKTGSMDELFDSLNGKASDEMVGRSFEFVDVEWQVFDADKGPIPLAVCQVVDLSTGEVTEFVTTGGMLVEFLHQAQLLNGYPFRARIVEKVTKSGNKALNFERV